MSDAKTEYSMAVTAIKKQSEIDEDLAKNLENSYLEIRRFGMNWVKANINDVVEEIAPGAHAEIHGRKVYYYNADRTMVVIADVAGYVRVAQIIPKDSGDRFHYLDVHGQSADNYTDEKGKQHGRKRSDKNAYTHYRIKHREEM
ncbi:hypothetical protein [Bifidobacterium apri]|uniref:Uncharacterized protein n=1 Tax=Bifidobacterium apri TaxID=1769423 RepID=A0A6A2VYH3_9BIFI|nr:hypothetical protein [Bifidobacterium apri]KAB8299583.1 hypothetical protein DSM100238_0617 [Bifidobacterium apri]